MALATDYDLQAAAPSYAWQAARPYVNGGISGMAAWMFVQPIDTVKVRLQLGTVSSPVLSWPVYLFSRRQSLSRHTVDVEDPAVQFA